MNMIQLKYIPETYFQRRLTSNRCLTYQRSCVCDGQHVPNNGGEDGNGQHDGHSQRQLLPGVRRQGEAQHRHAGDQQAGDDQVGEVVQCPPPYLDGEGDV